MLASSVQSVVACNATASRVCTLVLFIFLVHALCGGQRSVFWSVCSIYMKASEILGVGVGMFSLHMEKYTLRKVTFLSTRNLHFVQL